MSIEMVFVLVFTLLLILFITRKHRKKYRELPMTHNIIIYFNDIPTGLKENEKLNKIGYWYQDTDRTYRVDSKINADELKHIIMVELNLSQGDFSLRSTTDLFVPQGRL